MLLFGDKVSFIWSVADLIRDSFKRSKYPDVIWLLGDGLSGFAVTDLVSCFLSLTAGLLNLSVSRSPTGIGLNENKKQILTPRSHRQEVEDQVLGEDSGAVLPGFGQLLQLLAQPGQRVDRKLLLVSLHHVNIAVRIDELMNRLAIAVHHLLGLF